MFQCSMGTNENKRIRQYTWKTDFHKFMQCHSSDKQIRNPIKFINLHHAEADNIHF